VTHALILLAQRHWTGAAEPVLQIARGLVARGHRVTFFYTRVPPGHLSDHVDESVLGTLPEVKMMRSGFHPLAVLADRRRLRRFVRDENVDIVFCHQTHDHWLGAATVRGVKRPPVLVRQIHESRQLRRRFGYGRLFEQTEMLVVASQRWKQLLISEYDVDPSGVFVLPAAVDTAHFNPTQDTAAIRAEIGAAEGDKLIGMVSRIKPGRGHELALAAFAKVLQRQPGARLLFVGRGEGKEALEAEVAQTPFVDRVHFLGYRTDDLPAIYAALDVSLLLGEGSDGACRAALEAMACGTPVAALPVGTLDESIKDGETGVFVQADPDDLADGILEIMESPFLAQRARGHAEADLSIDRRIDRIEALFVRLAELR
jgi:L-malate glycosyltransferase